MGKNKNDTINFIENQKKTASLVKNIIGERKIIIELENYEDEIDKTIADLKYKIKRIGQKAF